MRLSLRIGIGARLLQYDRKVYGCSPLELSAPPHGRSSKAVIEYLALWLAAERAPAGSSHAQERLLVEFQVVPSTSSELFRGLCPLT
jgi:hypothetical protein